MVENAVEMKGSAAVASGVLERMLEPARHAGYDLPVIGTSQEPQGEFLWQAPTDRWWVFNDHRADPTAAQHGGVVVTDEVKERLTRLLAQGFDPDVILVGHETPQGWSPGSQLPDLVPAAERRTLVPARKSKMLGSLIASPRSLDVGIGALKVGKAAVVGGVAVGVALGALVGAVAAAAARLDPVIIAGVRDSGTGLVTWVEVARWDW